MQMPPSFLKYMHMTSIVVSIHWNANQNKHFQKCQLTHIKHIY